MGPIHPPAWSTFYCHILSSCVHAGCTRFWRLFLPSFGTFLNQEQQPMNRLSFCIDRGSKSIDRKFKNIKNLIYWLLLHNFKVFYHIILILLLHIQSSTLLLKIVENTPILPLFHFRFSAKLENMFVRLLTLVLSLSFARPQQRNPSGQEV